jgi:valyl-tRNA synthetase
VNPGVQAVVPNVIDTAKERERLQRELNKIDKELTTVEKKLGNPSFVERAPAAVVEKSERNASELRLKREQLEVALSRL